MERVARGLTPRATDWSLALLVAAGAASGLATWFAGSPGAAWVFVAHGAVGAALGIVAAVKWRRVRRRRHGLGLAALGAVVAVLGTGLVWSSGGRAYPGGISLLVWHGALGAILATAVFAHARPRARALRARDLTGRRQFLALAGIAAGALAVRELQRPLERVLHLPGARRRFTGSYDAGSFTGNAFPATSWLADRPRPIRRADYRLAVAGLVRTPLRLDAAALDRGDELVATLDCTGGFFSTQRWSGTTLGAVLDAAGLAPDGHHVRVISHTGYRWSFALDDARALLLATRVGGEPLAHEHGAPCRLVAPGHRGLAWVKWVERIEVHDHADPAALASTLWSGFTAAGGGA
jgi:DMSO/TMAO reductase YedYZ molybdopterin-dependent catalytic subunit